MKKLGRRGRLWLRAFHIFFMGAWIGVGISETIIPFFTGNASNGGELYAYYASVNVLDDFIIVPCAIGTLITGLLLAWQTAWGFFKHGWVIYAEAATIVAILLGVIWLGPAIDTLVAISEVEGLSALQNPEYVSAWNIGAILGIVWLLLLISAVFISVLKPWRKREGAEAAT